MSDCHVCEIPPGESLAPQRYPFEGIILVLAGRGSTRFSDDRGADLSFEWKAGTLFAVPPDATCRHFNGSGAQCARFAAVTAAPGVIDARGVEVTRDAACISDLDHVSLLDALECQDEGGHQFRIPLPGDSQMGK